MLNFDLGQAQAWLANAVSKFVGASSDYHEAGIAVGGDGYLIRPFIRRRVD